MFSQGRVHLVISRFERCCDLYFLARFVRSANSATGITDGRFASSCNALLERYHYLGRELFRGIIEGS